jgi:hypothetical protein
VGSPRSWRAAGTIFCVGEAAGKLVLGKNSVGATQLKKNAVTGKKIANNAVTGAKVKDESLSGADVRESSLGKVPSATTADQATSAATAGHATTADGLSPPEAWHEVGTPGNPSFQHGWENYSPVSFSTAGFFKDRLGYVHLRGVMDDGAMSQTAFVLPPGYRPAKGLVLTTAASHEFGELLIYPDGRIEPLIGTNGFFSLDGIIFPAA